MFWTRYMNWQSGDWGFPGSFIPWVIGLAIFEIVLKGLALWRSARREDKGWFIALLIVNTLGILPLIYLLTHSEPKAKRK